jgi:two-component system sensor histidine kinase RegB
MTAQAVYGAAKAADVRHVVAWLPAARWATCAALWGGFAAAGLLPHLDLSIRAILPLGLAAAICRTSIAALIHWRGGAPAWMAGLSLGADAALLTGLLDITGGPFNPFIVMYAVYIWLAVVTTPPVSATAVTAVSLAGFSWLVIDHLQVGALEHHRLNDFPTHLFTMWLSGTAVAELVALYITRAHLTLADRQRSLDEASARAVRSERLAALTALAAGAAHELSTPLATIAVAARELDRSACKLVEQGPVVATLRDDARLIRTEVDRCQVILDGMSGRANSATAGTTTAVPAPALAQLAQSRLPADQQARLEVEITDGVGLPAANGPELAQALSALLKNAFDASGPADRVRLRFTPRGSMVAIEVHDHGSGMSPEARSRAGEPFYTTKEPGRGLGLGLFLTRTLAERTGGSLRFEGTAGTIAILEVPALQADTP